MFETITSAAPDPILGLSEAFRADPRQKKINLTMGVYRDTQGNTPVLTCVKRAEEHILAAENSKIYLGIEGLTDFIRTTTELSLGNAVPASRVAVAQTPGGTGALRVAADFLAAFAPGTRVWCSTPTWPNHTSIFQVAGLEPLAYPYLAADRRSLDLNAWLDTLGSQGKPGDVVCLHACCHNPTGIDPTPEQWSEVAKLLAERGMIPLVDFAYQGFGEGLVEDRRSIEELVKYHDELFVCTSFSKNFGLYSERVGALMVISADDQVAERVESRIKQAVRSNYSNPPRHGAAIVATILADAELREVWVEELNSMRERIQDMRIKFVDAMKGTGCDTDFSFLLGQRGMFSYSGLTPLQVDWLRKEKGIYIVGSGRINVAGITAANLDELTAAIAESLRV